MSYKPINLSAKITSEFNTAFLGSLNIWILPLFFFAQFVKGWLGSYFFGELIFKLNENLTDASIKLLRTLVLSPIQQIFKLWIDCFLISSIVKISDKICVGWDDGLKPFIMGILTYFLNSCNFLSESVLNIKISP